MKNNINKDKCSCNHHEGSRGHGGGGSFVIGALLGAAAVYFFATPKGNKMLKHLMENGLENFSQYFDEDGLVDMDDMTGQGETVSESKKPSIKRFFKGIKK